MAVNAGPGFDSLSPTTLADVLVFARGVMPIPAAKEVVEPLNEPVRCGGVTVRPRDVVVGDEEGIVVVPRSRGDQVLADALAKAAREAEVSLEDWASDHRSRIDTILADRGFVG